MFCGAEHNVIDGACEICRDDVSALTPSIGRIKGVIWVSKYKYDDYSKNCIIDFKYHHQKWMAEYIAKLIFDELALNDIKYDVVTYVPITRRKFMRRMYNQSKAIAKNISSLSGMPLEKHFIKIKETESQTRLNYTQRTKNIHGAFEVCTSSSGKNVLVVDDVITTGATVNECAKLLKKNKAHSVYAASFMRRI